ncbi:MAG: hypothetical protein RMJ17_02945, partial [Candidatus Aenigmarchaeota archaeon]|nr:hypothetical protein [Candidatus Aenigmarchaeota archaeon]MDW8149524.1 hypothetical protein [Candidatus Aenigmarchaeota archaeon]
MYSYKVCFVGMGGSGIVGDLMKVILEKNGYEVIVVKDEKLPEFLNKKFKLFIISYSGNTYETLKCFREAIEKGIKNIIVVTSNGKLEKLCDKYEFKKIKVRGGLLPREALLDMLLPLLSYFKIKFKNVEYDFSNY